MEWVCSEQELQVESGKPHRNRIHLEGWRGNCLPWQWLYLSASAARPAHHTPHTRGLPHAAERFPHGLWPLCPVLRLPRPLSGPVRSHTPDWNLSPCSPACLLSAVWVPKTPQTSGIPTDILRLCPVSGMTALLSCPETPNSAPSNLFLAGPSVAFSEGL